MKAKSNVVKKVVFLSCAALLLAILIAVTCIVSVFDPMLTSAFGSTAIDDATKAAGEALATEIEEQGIVLVKNEDDKTKNPVLPLSKEDVTKGDKQQINVFGWAAGDWLAGGSGSGRSVNGSSSNLKPQTGLLEALKGYKVFGKDGVDYNTDPFTQIYSKLNGGKRNAASNDTLHNYDYDSCVLWEPTIDKYTDTIKDTAAAYSDVALVVLGRIAGESNDAPTTQYRYNGGSQKLTDSDKTYLDISVEEEDLLKYVGESFDKVIVIINSTNTMNLEFMDRIPGLDACLIAGGTGVNAANAIPNVLFGQKLQAKTDNDGNEIKDADDNVVYETVKVSPSARTVDTYAYSFKTNPNFVYSGSKGITAYTGTSNQYPIGVENANVSDKAKYQAVSYLDYAEGIYVGYKWYETADADDFWTSEFAKNTWGVEGYKDVVQYPFGYGLSYTKFDWKVDDWKDSDGKITVKVTVKNTGDYPGRDVVELYYTPPYTKGGIEKAAVNLCAFEKTLLLQPEESQTIELSFDIQDMASYDQTAKDNNGAYVLEAGKYNVSLRTDSHTVATVNPDGKAATFEKEFAAATYNTYAGSNGTEKIKNLFGQGTSDGIAADGSDSETGIENVWLSRKDFAGTFKTQKAGARAWNNKLTTNNKYTKTTADAWDAAWKLENGDFEGNYGVDNGYLLYDKSLGDDPFTEDAYFFGNPENYNSPKWDDLLDQLTKDEFEKLALHGYIHEEAIDSIGKPRTTSVDGPSQIGSFNVDNPGVGYPMASVLAQTWSAALSESFGKAVGTEALGSGRDGWYAPGVNLHRSAFGGRNYEYYSEDSYLSGVMCAKTVRGALNAGVYTYIKHLIGYDQESMRDSLYCWMTEQNLRETYLKPFKIAIDEGATGLMTSYGRLGSIWSGGSEALLTDLLRNEWGYKGTVITDYSDHQDFMNGDQMLRAGGDLWMDGYMSDGKWVYGSTTSDAFQAQLRSSAKHIIYTWSNAAFEAKDSAKRGGGGFKWWWAIVGTVDALCAAGAGVLIFFGVREFMKKPEVEAAASTEPVAGDKPE